MYRPLRLEFAGALYHVISRGDRRDDIYRTYEDRQQWTSCRDGGWDGKKLLSKVVSYHY